LTLYEDVFKSFLSKIQNDEDYTLYTHQELEDDFITIMENAIPMFMFPRQNLYNKDNDLEVFNDTLSLDTISVLTDFMVYQWNFRKTNNTDSMHQLKADSSINFYSQSAHLDALVKKQQAALQVAIKNESRYYRSNQGKPNVVGLVGEQV